MYWVSTKERSHWLIIVSNPSFLILTSLLSLSLFFCSWKWLQLPAQENRIKLSSSLLPSLASTYIMDLDLLPHFFFPFVLGRFPFLSSPLHQTLTSSPTLNKKMHLLYCRTLSWSEETEAGAISSPMGWYFICSSGTHEHVTEPGTVLQ